MAMLLPSAAKARAISAPRPLEGELNWSSLVEDEIGLFGGGVLLRSFGILFDLATPNHWNGHSKIWLRELTSTRQ
jgi:hypothetical protein